VGAGQVSLALYPSCNCLSWNTADPEYVYGIDLSGGSVDFQWIFEHIAGCIRIGAAGCQDSIRIGLGGWKTRKAGPTRSSDRP